MAYLSLIVIPAQAGIQFWQSRLDSLLRGNDAWLSIIYFKSFLT